jgi:hypothetical protein
VRRPGFWAGAGSGIVRAAMTKPASRVPALALALSLVATVTACDKGKSADGEAKSEDKTEEKAEDKKADDKPAAADDKQADAGDAKPAGDDKAPTPSAATITASGGDGVAYFGVSNRGIAKLDASGWSMVVSDSRAYYSKVFTGPDNTVYVWDFDALKKIDGDKLTEVAKFDFNTFSSPSYMAPSRDGSKFYATGFKGFGVFEGGKWTVTEAKAIKDDLDSLTGVAVAGDGTVWVSGSKALLHNTGGTWSALDLSALGEYFFFQHLSASPTGDVFVNGGRELYKLTAEKAEKIEFKLDSRNYTSYSLAMDYNSKGRILAASGSCELIALDPGNPGSPWLVNKGEYNCLSLNTVAYDDQDRAWVFSREGLSVIGPDKTVAEYPSGSVMEIVTSNMTGIAVIGNGPPLPAAGPARTGGVTGKILLEGTAVANSKIEMCATPAFGASQPCFDSKVKFAGTTDDKGEFTFNDVPIGQYNVAVEIDGKWQISYLSSLATDMKEGATYDVGAVKFNKF